LSSLTALGPTDAPTLRDLLQLLRTISVTLVKAVGDWRGATGGTAGSPPAPFDWGGANYLVKMAGDSDFLGRVKTKKEAQAQAQAQARGPGSGFGSGSGSESELLSDFLGVSFYRNPFFAKVTLDGSGGKGRGSGRQKKGKYGKNKGNTQGGRGGVVGGGHWGEDTKAILLATRVVAEECVRCGVFSPESGDGGVSTAGYIFNHTSTENSISRQWNEATSGARAGAGAGGYAGGYGGSPFVPTATASSPSSSSSSSYSYSMAPSSFSMAPPHSASFGIGAPAAGGELTLLDCHRQASAASTLASSLLARQDLEMATVARQGPDSQLPFFDAWKALMRRGQRVNKMGAKRTRKMIRDVFFTWSQFAYKQVMATRMAARMLHKKREVSEFQYIE